jgi:Cu(I)/Ag(I) efflux system membrane fusion protein/cobalt-zinc-cadmium efflux system membrane fusion protein
MKNGINNYLQLAFVVCMIIVSISIAGCGDDHKGHDHGDMNQQETKVDSSIIRTGEIDLLSLDVNKDGKVYQDPMDWNVISDEPGKCPLCKMELKEVSLEKAKENLIKHNFKVK